jgi:hypothetical protein
MHNSIAIVPAYNEAGAIGTTVRDIFEHAPGFDVVVVDDGSTDETAELARHAGAAVVRLPFNLGIGGAVQAGYQYALEHDYDIAVQVDGDGQHDARHINELLAHLRSNVELNMITGSRFLVSEPGGFRSTLPRRLGIRLFARLLSSIVRQPVTDPTSGFRMVTRRGIELFARDYPHDYPEVEAVLLLHFHKLRSTEVPVTMRERMTGTSSINRSRSVYYMIKVSLAIFVGLLRARPAVEAGDYASVTAESSI